MFIFQDQTASIREIREVPFKLEREIQRMFEKNLELITGLTLVKSEFSIKNKRIDTLAFDEQTKAFVIIEYKRSRNASVVDQGFTYLNLMLENKAEFIVEYNEGLGKKLKRGEVDWSQTRVLFVSSDFTENQIAATNFNDIAIELWKVKRYENHLIVIDPIKKTKSSESIKPLIQDKETFKAISEEIKVYTEEDHLKKSSEKIIELYEKFKEAILNLTDGIDVDPKMHYIAFKKNGNVADIVVNQNSLKISINAKTGTLDDPKKLIRDVSNIGHWGNGDYEITVKDDANLEYIMSLIRQTLK